jgi:hypothetical protein
MTSTTKTTGAVHLHPLLKVERESRAGLGSIALGLVATDRRAMTLAFEENSINIKMSGQGG